MLPVDSFPQVAWAHLQGVDAFSIEVQGEADEVTVFGHHICKIAVKPREAAPAHTARQRLSPVQSPGTADALAEWERPWQVASGETGLGFTGSGSASETALDEI